MTGKRNTFLLNKAIGNYLAASVLTMIISQLNVTVDGIIVSNLIGPDALSAINLFMPINIVITCIYTCFAMGATIRASKAIGRRDKDAEKGILSTAVFSVVCAGLLLAVLGTAFHGSITAFVCREERLAVYFKPYMHTMLLFSFITILQMLLVQIACIEGYPKIGTVSCVISVSVNIVLDLLFVGVFGFGITGSALASIIGYLIALVTVYYFLTKKHNCFKIRFSFSDIKEHFGKNALQGLPLMISNIIMMIMMFLLNNIVQSNLGADGMFVLSVCINVLSLGMMCSNGFGSTAMAIGGNLYGQRDFEGLRMLLNRCLSYMLIVTLAATILIEFFPASLASLFGANTPELKSMAVQGIRIFIVMLVPFCITLTMLNVFQIVGHPVLTPVLAVLFPVILIPSTLIWTRCAGAESLWYAFPETGFLLLLVLLVVTEAIRFWKRPKQLSFLTLVPADESGICLELSIQATIAAVGNSLPEIRDFLNDNVKDEEFCNDVMLSTEEMMYNIAIHGDYRNESHFFDLRIMTYNDELTVVLKDDGKPFDPSTLTEDKKNLGLKIVTAFAPKLEYKFMYGQNVTFMTWNIK